MPKRFLIALLLLLLLFFPLVWISQYNYPSGDDFYMASLAKRLGALEATKWWYFNEAGRYSYIFLQSLISTSNSWLVIYKAFPVVLLVAGFASLYYFVRAFWGRALTKTTSFILAAALYALLISLTPDIATAFYWLNTNIQYAGAVFTSLVIFALYIDFYRIAKTSTRVAYALMIAILIIILAGLNEVSVLLFIATFGFINLLFILKFKRSDKWALAFFFVSVVFSLVSFLAPGTHARVLEVSAEFHPLNVLAGAVALTVYLLTELLTTTPLLPATIIYLAFLNQNRDKLDDLSALLRGLRSHWILLFILLAITAANSVIFAAVGVNSLPDRLKNVYVYTIFFAWLVFVTALFFDLSDKKFNFSVPNWVTGALALFVLGFLLTGYKLEVGGGNTIPTASRSQRFFSLISARSVYAQAYLDILSGRAERFSAQNEEREQRIRNSEGSSVDFPLYSYVPETIFIQDVNHPFGAPYWLSVIICGEAKHLNYVETGPPPPQKKKF